MTSALRHPARRPRRSALLALAAAAVLAAVLVLVFTRGENTGSLLKRPGANGATVVQLASGYLGISPAELRRRLRSGETLAQIAATKGVSRAALIERAYRARARAVKRRHLAPAEERIALAALRQQIASQVDRRHGSRRVPAAAARYLGVSEAELSTQLAAGRTLGQVAAATPGRSRAGLLDVLIAARRKSLETAVRDRQITPSAARDAAAGLRARSLRLMDRPGG